MPKLGGLAIPPRLRALVPDLFGTRDQFRGKQFFHRPGQGRWFGDDSSAVHLLSTLFLVSLHQSTSVHQALDPGGRGPCPRGGDGVLESCCLGPLRLHGGRCLHLTELALPFCETKLIGACYTGLLGELSEITHECDRHIMCPIKVSYCLCNYTAQLHRRLSPALQFQVWLCCFFHPQRSVTKVPMRREFNRGC